MHDQAADTGHHDGDVVEVVIEIPAGSRNKYEYDHERHLIRLDRRLLSATVYPADYGFVVDTLSEDGDPLDALVLLEDPTFPGCVVSARPLGIFWMRDEKGRDAKIIAVLAHDPRWDGVVDIAQIPASLLNEIEHFFSVYKDLEPGKLTEVGGFEGREAAWREIGASVERLASSSAGDAPGGSAPGH
ncbi:MAG: inorganic diphosphatase [Actinomycetota bacterium]|jgi:inorganic pyrophosphatase|nr:inorganic diphosphatase [Actinomycetota bacterium]MDA8280699.1 inorganic diphosphatase [Actinomycetota bacterium]